MHWKKEVEFAFLHKVTHNLCNGPVTSLNAGAELQPRFVCCFDNLGFETPAMIRVEIHAGAILIYCWSALVYKLFGSKCSGFASCVQQPLLVLVLPAGLVMTSGISRQQSSSQRITESTHTVAG